MARATLEGLLKVHPEQGQARKELEDLKE
jgi:hypothetical protein